jgi:NitT/TauT family transport system substrate-binding protein
MKKLPNKRRQREEKMTDVKAGKVPIIALLIAGLLGAMTVTPARAEDKLRVGKAVAAAFSFVPLDVGIETGIFKQHGIEIEQASFAGSARLQQGLASDSIDIGLGSGPELAFVAKGAPVLGVAAMAGPPLLFALIVRTDGPIHTVADLKDKKISVTTVGSLTSWLVRELSRHEGWGPDGIHVLELGSDPAQIAALKTNQTDGMPVDLATAYKLEQTGEFRILMHFGDLVKDFHIHVIYASNAILRRNPDSVRRFLAGWFETIAFMRQHRDETVKIAAPVMNVDTQIAGRTYDELMPMFSDTGRFEPKALAVLSRSFVEMKLLPEEPDMSKLYTEKYLPGK